MTRFDASGPRLPAPGELFARFMPQPATRPQAAAQIPLKTPAMPVSTLSLNQATATARSLPVLNFVSSQLQAVNLATPARNVAAASPVAMPASPARPSSKALNLPPRPANALTGSQFVEQIRRLTGPAREAAVLAQVLAGNVPASHRQFKAIDISAKGADGKAHTATVHVMPDYLAIGSDEDFMLMPMDPMTAQRIADASGASLPTRKIVDAAYASAEVKLVPKPKPSTGPMMSTGYYAEHNATIAGQRAKAGAAPGMLIAGHKKDLILSNKLDAKPRSVAIYGWHEATKDGRGKAIQPPSTKHEDTYADYSHGVRLIGASVTVDGVERPLAEVLQDRNLAPLLSDEGPLLSTRIKLR